MFFSRPDDVWRRSSWPDWARINPKKILLRWGHSRSGFSRCSWWFLSKIISMFRTQTCAWCAVPDPIRRNTMILWRFYSSLILGLVGLTGLEVILWWLRNVIRFTRFFNDLWWNLFIMEWKICFSSSVPIRYPLNFILEQYKKNSLKNSWTKNVK